MARLNEIFNNLNIPDDVTVDLEPRDYQLEDAHQLINWRRCSNFSEVGTGKSLVSYLWIMHRLYSGVKVLVIMPPPLITQYVSNFSVIQNHPFSMAVIKKDIKKRNAEMDVWDKEGWPDVLFMSYQMFIKYHKYLKVYKALVADEAHVMSNAQTKAFQMAYLFVFSRDAYFLEMTATPMTTEIRSAYGHIRLKTPEAYLDLAHFDRTHVVYKHLDLAERAKGIKQIAGYKNLELIDEHINRFAVRRRARDVLSLEEPNIIEHTVELEPAHSELYRTLLEERIIELGDEVLVAKNQQALRQMALQIITNYEDYTDVVIDDEPLANLQAIVEALDGKKLAVFCFFKATVRKLNKVFAKLNPALVYGDSDVQKNVDKFLNDDTCKMAILNYKSGGAGFNLQSVCHNVVFFETTGSPGEIEQALGRVQRSGQTEVVNAWMFRYRVTAGSTLSSKLLVKAYNRSSDIKIVMDDEVSFVDYLRRDLKL